MSDPRHYPRLGPGEGCRANRILGPARVRGCLLRRGHAGDHEAIFRLEVIRWHDEEAAQ